MYGVVVMAALMGGAQATDHGYGKGWYPGCYGCYGYGCYGNTYAYGYGGCSGCGGCHGCYGCYGCLGSSWSCWGCYGCYGCWGSSPYYPMYQGGPSVVPGSVMPGADMKKSENAVPPNRARLTVELPAEAKLFIDDQPMKATSSVRHFRTPELTEGQTYYYVIKVELATGGVTHTETKRVLLKAGEQINASFTAESIAAASKAGSSAKR